MSDVLGGDLRSELTGAGLAGTPADDKASSGHHAVDAAIRAVDNAAGLSAPEQIAAYEAAHRTLREVLSSIEE